MSQGVKVPLAQAEAIAKELVALLAPACARIEIAGSVRRRRPEVGDIEIVAVGRETPEPGGDLWGETTSNRDELGELIARLWSEDVLTPRLVEVHRADGSVGEAQRMGTKFRALRYRGHAIDLFTTSADLWGAIFAIRTGPKEWNERLVVDCKRYFRRLDQGRVMHFNQVVPCPEERDFLEALGQEWVEPWERSAERVAIHIPRIG